MLVGPLGAPTHRDGASKVLDLHVWLWDTNILNWWRAKINMMLRAWCTKGGFG